MKGMYGKGHIPNPHNSEFEPIQTLLAKIGSPGPLPASYSLREYAGLVRDQSITSACVAFAGVTAIYLRAHRLEIDMPVLSPLASYALTRGTALLPHEELIDQGSIPRDFFETALAFGVCPESVLPFDPSIVNDPLDLDVFEGSTRIGSYHSIFEEGWMRGQRIREAIYAGTGVCFAMAVDKAYEELDSLDVYQDRTGPSLGGHYQLITGYGPGYFEVMGSWGIGFGEAGIVHIAEEYICNPVECTDLMAIDIPRST